ncbi:hypothetical protein JCM5353_006175 [Sporobolomyces roseus]
MSLSSLPTELVRQIIESSVPSTFHSTTYKERQSTLRSLCLVSRLFRHLAQPLLSEIVWIKSHEKLAIILEWMESKGWSDIPRSVALDDSTETWIKASDVEKLAHSCSRLQELALNLEYSDKLDAFDLNVLQSFSHLTHLQVSGVCTISSPFALPALESFSFNYTTLNSVAIILDVALLPSLRRLALVEVDLEEEVELLSQCRLGGLIKQTEVLSLDIVLVHLAPAYLANAFDRTLFDFHIGDEGVENDLVQVEHLRIIGFSAKSNVGLAGDLSHLTRRMEELKDQLSLRSIYLDVSLAQSSKSSSDVRTQVNELVKLCDEKGIRVIYEAQPQGRMRGVDPWFSEEFHRRQMEEKRRVKKE